MIHWLTKDASRAKDHRWMIHRWLNDAWRTMMPWTRSRSPWRCLEPTGTRCPWKWSRGWDGWAMKPIRTPKDREKRWLRRIRRTCAFHPRHHRRYEIREQPTDGYDVVYTSPDTRRRMCGVDSRWTDLEGRICVPRQRLRFRLPLVWGWIGSRRLSRRARRASRARNALQPTARLPSARHPSALNRWWTWSTCRHAPFRRSTIACASDRPCLRLLRPLWNFDSIDRRPGVTPRRRNVRRHYCWYGYHGDSCYYGTSSWWW